MNGTQPYDTVLGTAIALVSLCIVAYIGAIIYDIVSKRRGKKK